MDDPTELCSGKNACIRISVTGIEEKSPKKKKLYPNVKLSRTKKLNIELWRGEKRAPNW